MKRSIIALVFSIFLLAAVFPAFADTSPETLTVTVTYGQTEARSMLAMINAFRTGSEAWYWNQDNTAQVVCSNLAELTYDYELEAVAMQRAAEAAIHFAHTRPDGTKCYTAFPSMSYSGENIAAGQRTAEAAFVSWREDDDDYSGQGHRRNMLSDKFNCIGIGHVVYNGRHYWTHTLGKRTSPVTTPTEAADSEQSVTVRVSPDLVKTVTCANLMVEAMSQTDFPTVTFVMTETWPQTSKITYTPLDAASAPSWTSSDTDKITTDGTALTTRNVGTAQLSTTVFGQALTTNVTITQKDIAGATVSAETDELTYTGSALTPAVMVSLGGIDLIPGQDYTTAYSNNTGVTDTALVTVTGQGNYKGTAGTSFAIVPRPVTISGISAADKTYDGTTDATVTGTAVITGKANTDDLSVLPGTAAFTDANAGSGKTVKFTGFSLTGTAAGNYVLEAQPADTTANITPAPLTVQANDKTITYGDAPGNSGAVFSGFVNNETEAVLTGTLAFDYSYAQGDNAGDNYTITPKGVSAGNYSISFVPGTLQVLPAGVSLTANSVTVTYDGTEKTVSEFTASVPGLSFTGVSAGAGRTDAGETAVTFTGVSVNETKDTTGNYVVTAVTDGKLTVEPVTLGLAWTAGTFTYNGQEQAPALEMTGVISGDDVAATVTGAKNAGSNLTAAVTSLTGAKAKNYRLPEQKSTSFTISKANATITANNAMKISGSADPVLSADVTGTVAGETLNYKVSRAEGEAVGEYAVTVTLGDNPNYEITAVEAIFQIFAPFGPASFTLPASIATIGESVFEGDGAITIIDAQNCAAIGKNAFRGCDQLTQIRLPKNCDLDPDAFDPDGLIYVYAPAGGTTEQYCSEHEHVVFVEE